MVYKKISLMVLLLLAVLAVVITGYETAKRSDVEVEGAKTVLSVTGKSEEKNLKYVQKLLNSRYGKEIEVTSITMDTVGGVPYVMFTAPNSLIEHRITYSNSGENTIEGWNMPENDDYWTELSGWLNGELLLNLYGKELGDGLQVYSTMFDRDSFTSATVPSLYAQTLSYINTYNKGVPNRFNLFTDTEVEKGDFKYEEHWRKVIRWDAMKSIIAKRGEELRLILFVQNIYQIDEVVEALKHNKYGGSIEVYTVNKEVPLASIDYVLNNLSKEEKSSLIGIDLNLDYAITDTVNFEFELGKLLAEEVGLDTDSMKVQLLDSIIPYTEDKAEQLEGIAELLDWGGVEPILNVYTFGEVEIEGIKEKLNKTDVRWIYINIYECEEEDKNLGFSELQQKVLQK